MSRICFLSIMWLSLLAASAYATAVEVPLPGLLGTYPIDAQHAERTVSFTLPDPPGTVFGVSFRVSGTTEVGALECEGTISEWPTMLSASMEDTPTRLWFASAAMPLVAGPFAWTAPFQPTPPIGTTWNFLRDGTAEVTLFGGPSGYILICSEVSAPPTLTVTEAVLIIDAEFPIRTEATTWGRIKALYLK